HERRIHRRCGVLNDSLHVGGGQNRRRIVIASRSGRKYRQHESGRHSSPTQFHGSKPPRAFKSRANRKPLNADGSSSCWNSPWIAALICASLEALPFFA